jgi:hypothetical protein
MRRSSISLTDRRVLRQVERAVLLGRPEVLEGEHAVLLPPAEVRRQGPGGEPELVGVTACHQFAHHGDELDAAADAGSGAGLLHARAVRVVGRTDRGAPVGQGDEAELRILRPPGVGADDDALVGADPPSTGSRRALRRRCRLGTCACPCREPSTPHGGDGPPSWPTGVWVVRRRATGGAQHRGRGICAAAAACYSLPATVSVGLADFLWSSGH